jgi:hypothetical protein
MNCIIIDACMHLHNFIVDQRKNNRFSATLDHAVFDDDCRWFFAVNPFLEDIGIQGGEDNVGRNEDGEVSRGG